MTNPNISLPLSSWVRRVLWAAFLFPVCQMSAPASDKALCPNLIASLVTVPGNLDAQYAAQRLEIRQCPVDIGKKLGVFQLAAWSEGAPTPGLVYETEESGFYQFAMIEGVYVFEFMGGTAQSLVAIAFVNGTPKVELLVSTLAEPTISSTSSGIVVEYIDSKDNKLHRRKFTKSGKTQRKGWLPKRIEPTASAPRATATAATP